MHWSRIGPLLSAHRLTKRDELPIGNFTTVGEGEARSASPSLIVAADLKQWKDIWTRLGDSPTVQWLQAQCDDTILPITGSDFVAPALSFYMTTTSIGSDAFPPKALHWLSPQLQQSIADFLKVVELNEVLLQAALLRLA